MIVKAATKEIVEEVYGKFSKQVLIDYVWSLTQEIKRLEARTIDDIIRNMIKEEIANSKD